MHRFFVTNIRDDRATLAPEQAHQVRHVLRMEAGDRIVVLDNAGWEYEAELVQVGRQVTAVLHHKRPAPDEPAVRLTLYQSVLKRDNFEWVLQKGTELGVARFVPLLSERTVAHPPNKPDRWQRILTEAAEQSRRGRIPELAAPTALASALDDRPAAEMGLMPWEEAAGGEVDAAISGEVTAVSLFIGPEGGFAPQEVDRARACGVQPVTLGPRILRAETAALVATTLVMHRLGALKLRADG